MAKSESKLTFPESQRACQVVTVYEDTACRGGAMLACNHLVQQFWNEIEFNFSWWRFEYLRDPELAAAAARAASKADLVVVSAYSEGLFHPAIPLWIERWAKRRSLGESALLGLFWTEEGQTNQVCAKHIYLKEVARRAGLEFLSQLPRKLPELDAMRFPFVSAVHRHRFTDDFVFHGAPTHEGGINE